MPSNFYRPFAHSASVTVPHLATFNLCGLGATQQRHDLRRRHKCANITCLTSSFGVTCLQETHLARTHRYFRTGFPHIQPEGSFYSSHSSNSAGVATLISNQTLDLYQAEEVSLPSSLRGYALAVLLTPRNHCGPRILYLNTYLYNSNKKIDQVRELANAPLPTNCLTFLCGDLNFILSDMDSSRGSNHKAVSAAFRKTWLRFLDKFALQEHHQERHTRYGTSSHSLQPCSSRLDRIYSNLAELDFEMLRPDTTLVKVPHSVLAFDHSSGVFRFQQPRPTGASDHLPVGLTFHGRSAEPTSHANPSIPRWVVQDEGFLPAFQTRWDRFSALPSDPFVRMATFKETVHRAAKQIRRRRAAEKRLWLDTFSKMNVATSILHSANHSKLTRNTQLRYIQQFEFLSKHTTPDGLLDLDTLREELNSLYCDGEIDTRSLSPPHPRLPPAHTASPDPFSGLDGDSANGVFDETKKAKPTVLDAIKVLLPSSRKRLPGLRKAGDGDLHTDREEVGQIAKDYWGKIWAPPEGPSDEDTEQYCGEGGFTQADVPFPVQETIYKALRESGNSSAGPDGIPFAALRALAPFFAPIAAAIVKALAEGIMPPSGYNHGYLYLLPKKGMHTPADTRPITVTNSDNRVIAAAVVLSVTEIVNERLDTAQQGFIHGRNYYRHIQELNHHFYTVVESPGKDDYFALFMDTAKAFDSIIHKFIHAAIRRLGLPLWLSNLVRGLLCEVVVHYLFKGSVVASIPVHRGVKQGCPLSPLLFAICYDVLLTQLRPCPNVTCWAMADDLALGSSTFGSFQEPMRIVSRYRQFSGLGQNMEKTHVIAAQDCDLSMVIRSCPWPDMEQTDSEVYLGIPFGRSLTLADIFTPTVKRISQRCDQFSGALRKMSLQRRIITFNIFVTSMLTYILMFHPVPGSGPIYEQLRALYRTHIIPWRGKGYKYFHLLQPPNRFGPAKALTDFWARSLAMAAARQDLHEFDEVKSPTELDWMGDDSLLITEQTRANALDFIELDIDKANNPNQLPFRASTWDDDNPRRRRQRIYRRIVYAEYHKVYQDKDLKRILRKRGVQGTEDNVRRLHKGFAALTPLKPRFRDIQFRLTLNALPTQRRGRWFTTAAESCRPCYLCGTPTSTDHYSHIFFGECVAVNRARVAFSRGIGLDISPSGCGAISHAACALLVYPQTSSNKQTAQAICTLNAAAWEERTFHYANFTSIDRNVHEVSDRIARSARRAWNHLNRPKLSRGLGNASTRTPEQQARARDQARALIAKLDPDGIHVYTDGSAQGNPGPCGAGFYISWASHSQDEAVGLIKRGTNNLGELWAIGAAIQRTEELKITAPPNSSSNAYILTDSTYAQGCLNKGWTPQAQLHKAIVATIKSMIRASSLQWYLNWIPAHVGLEGNEAADQAAARGADLSKRGQGFKNLLERAKHGRFTYSNLYN